MKAERPKNAGFIAGKLKIDGYSMAKVQLNSVVGDGNVTIFDGNGDGGFISTTTDSQGHFLLGFMWEPSDVGKVVNTNLRAKVSVTGVTTSATSTSYTIIKSGLEIPLCVCSRTGGNVFNPLDGYISKWGTMSKKFYGIFSVLRLVKAPFNKALDKLWNMPTLSNVSKVSIETYCMLGVHEE